MVDEDNVARFQHVVELLYGLVDGQRLAVLCALFLLDRVEFLEEEDEWLPGVLDALLQHGTHDGRAGVCDECKWHGRIGVLKYVGALQTRLATFEGLVEFDVQMMR
jgi:hypothetical protein